jgi:methyl coenzyme M reductase subunit C
VALQAADVIASAVARVARMALRPVEEWTEDLQRLAEVTLSALMLEDDSGTPLVAGIFADSNTKVAILTRILLHGQRSSK